MAAVLFIQVLSADHAQPFAVRTADRFVWHLKLQVFTDELLKIDVAVFGDDQFFLGERPVLKSKIFFKFCMKSLLEGFQAAAAFRIRNSMNFGNRTDAVVSSCQGDHPAQVFNRKFFFKGITFSFDGYFAQSTDWLVNKKSNVNSKRSPVRIHDNSSKIGGVFKIIACGVTQVKFF